MNELEQEVLDDVKVVDDLKDIPAAPAEPEIPGLEGSTIRLDQLPHLDANFVAAQEAAMEKECPNMDAFADTPEEEEEPCYIPPVRVMEHPRSRLKDLKRQLAQGPEKRYQELSRQPIGKLQLCLVLTLVLMALSAALAGLYAAGLMGASRMRLMVFSQVFIMLMAALLGCAQLMEGVGDLFVRGRFTLNTLLAATFVACCCDALYCFQDQRVPLCAAFALEVAMSLWAKHHRYTTELGQMDTLRKAVRLEGLYRMEQFYDGKAGIIRDQGLVEDFMDYYDEPSLLDDRQNRYAMIALFVSCAIAIVAGLRHGVTMALLILSTSMLVSVPASFFVALTRPAAVLENKLHRLGSVVCGCQGVEGMTGQVAVPLCDNDMFPKGTTKMNGVKFYGDRDPDEIIAYAAALFRVTGGGLAPIFEELLESRNAPKYDAVNVRKYHSGGVGGEVHGEPVLIGTLKFLKDMGVEIPNGTMVNQAVHLSIDGQLAGLFAINYNRSKYSAAGLATLAADRKITAVITAGDFLLNDNFLKSKFGINPKHVAFPTPKERFALNRVGPAEGDIAMALVTREGLAPAACAITGARALWTANCLGLLIHKVGGILGMVIMLLLAIIGSEELLTPINVLLYQLIWMIPGLLVTAWPKTI